MTTTSTKPTQAMLGLPAERLAQLRTLAHNQGTTAVGVVERMIRRAIEEGDLEDMLPGFCEVTVITGQEMVVTIRGECLPTLNRAEALTAAALIDAAAGNPSELGEEFQVGRASGFPIGGRLRLVIGRHARAVLLALQNTQTGETLFETATSAGIATDFARILRNEAAKMAPALFQNREDGSQEPTAFYKRLIERIAAPSVRANGEAR